MDTGSLCSVTSYIATPLLLCTLAMLGFYPFLCEASIVCVDCSGPGCQHPGTCRTNAMCFLRCDVNGLLYRGCADDQRWGGLHLDYTGCRWQNYLGWADSRVLWCLCAEPNCNNVTVGVFLVRNLTKKVTIAPPPDYRHRPTPLPSKSYITQSHRYLMTQRSGDPHKRLESHGVDREKTAVTPTAKNTGHFSSTIGETSSSNTRDAQSGSDSDTGMGNESERDKGSPTFNDSGEESNSTSKSRSSRGSNSGHDTDSVGSSYTDRANHTASLIASNSGSELSDSLFDSDSGIFKDSHTDSDSGSYSGIPTDSYSNIYTSSPIDSEIGRYRGIPTDNDSYRGSSPDSDIGSDTDDDSSSDTRTDTASYSGTGIDSSSIANANSHRSDSDNEPDMGHDDSVHDKVSSLTLLKGNQARNSEHLPKGSDQISDHSSPSGKLSDSEASRHNGSDSVFTQNSGNFANDYILTGTNMSELVSDDDADSRNRTGFNVEDGVEIDLTGYGGGYPEDEVEIQNDHLDSPQSGGAKNNPDYRWLLKDGNHPYEPIGEFGEDSLEAGLDRDRWSAWGTGTEPLDGAPSDQVASNLGMGRGPISGGYLDPGAPREPFQDGAHSLEPLPSEQPHSLHSKGDSTDTEMLDQDRTHVHDDYLNEGAPRIPTIGGELQEPDHLTNGGEPVLEEPLPDYIDSAKGNVGSRWWEDAVRDSPAGLDSRFPNPYPYPSQGPVLSTASIKLTASGDGSILSTTFPVNGQTMQGATKLPHQTQALCPATFKVVPHLRSCYHVDRAPRTWYGAAEHCTQLHPRAHLVAVDRPGEFEYVMLKVAMEPKLLTGWQGWWTSGHFDVAIREFTWSDTGRVISRLDPRWRQGMLLSPYSGTCVWFVPLAGFKLANYGCRQPAGAICEIGL